VTNDDLVVAEAAYKGLLDKVDELDPNGYYIGFSAGAALGGQLTLVKELLSRGECDMDLISTGVTLGNYRELLEQVVE